ncbi:MAG: Anaerobic sulfite reductase subunit B [Firmicutes bacterium ADurb.Bin419]|nr:MAG: Anaerobic sulfite reductase subunit B [Firmicutes bacterium ADurb.Bin419]
MIDLLKVNKAVVKDIREESKDVKTLILEPQKSVDFKPGQFILISKLGVGESPFAISSDPVISSTFEVSVQRMGKNTSSIHELGRGEEIEFRGPYGNYFPIEQWKGKAITVIGGGIGMAPLRSLLYGLIHHQHDFKRIELLYGIRSFDKILYKDVINSWKDKISVQMICEQPSDSDMRVGLITNLIKEMHFDPEEHIVVICGPHKMIEACIHESMKKGIESRQIYVSLEMKMKCGVGICGRCNIDHRYICKEGPVFQLEEVKDMFISV